MSGRGMTGWSGFVHRCIVHRPPRTARDSPGQRWTLYGFCRIVRQDRWGQPTWQVETMRMTADGLRLTAYGPEKNEIRIVESAAEGLRLTACGPGSPGQSRWRSRRFLMPLQMLCWQGYGGM